MRDNNIHSEFLKTLGVDWSSKAMTTSIGTYYSDPISVRSSKGFAGLLVTTSAGSLAINLEVSLDGNTFYTPYDSAGNALDVVYAAVTVGSKWISFDPIVSRFIRFKFVLTGADASVSAKYIQQE